MLLWSLPCQLHSVLCSVPSSCSLTGNSRAVTQGGVQEGTECLQGIISQTASAEELQEAVEQVGKYSRSTAERHCFPPRAVHPSTDTHSRVSSARGGPGSPHAPGSGSGRPGPQCSARTALPPPSARPPWLRPLRRGCGAAPHRDWPAGLLVLPSLLSLALCRCHCRARLLRSQTVFPLGSGGSCVAHRARVGSPDCLSAQ